MAEEVGKESETRAYLGLRHEALKLEDVTIFIIAADGNSLDPLRQLK